MLEALETIDDDCDEHGIVFVKISDDEKTSVDMGLTLPSLVYFENRIPHLFEGDLSDAPAVLKWLIRQLKSDEIEEVTMVMMQRLITEHPFVAVLFCE